MSEWEIKSLVFVHIHMSVCVCLSWRRPGIKFPGTTEAARGPNIGWRVYICVCVCVYIHLLQMSSPTPMESSMMRAATDTTTMITTGFCSLDANATGSGEKTVLKHVWSNDENVRNVNIQFNTSDFLKSKVDKMISLL